MTDVAIRTENLSKRYRIAAPQTDGKSLRRSVQGALASPFAYLRSTLREPTEAETVWALMDASFEVKQGEVIGVIGRNGAGKSTLLKLLSRITEPTHGRAELRGRVSSLLEVGTGFHKELTGRENVYLNGAIHGMSRAEIRRKFDEIVTFAEVEKFIDTPVKRYSSGMHVRLAFSVAAHLEPEILLVDEVLAVGDIGFQKKSLGKLEEAASGGRTVLFVSHNMGMISMLCEKAMLLQGGRITMIGPVQEAISAYLAQFGAKSTLRREWGFDETPDGTITSTSVVRIRSVAITDQYGVAKPYFSTTEPIHITVQYWVVTDDVPVIIGLSLYNEQGNLIFVVTNTMETKLEPIDKTGLYSTQTTISPNLLNSGKYFITVHLNKNIDVTEALISHCVGFEAVDDNPVDHRGWSGLIKPKFGWQSQKIGEAPAG